LVHKDELLSIVQIASEKVVGNTSYNDNLFNKIFKYNKYNLMIYSVKSLFRSKKTAAVARSFPFWVRRWSDNFSSGNAVE